MIIPLLFDFVSVFGQSAFPSAPDSWMIFDNFRLVSNISMSVLVFYIFNFCLNSRIKAFMMGVSLLMISTSFFMIPYYSGTLTYDFTILIHRATIMIFCTLLFFYFHKSIGYAALFGAFTWQCIYLFRTEFNSEVTDVSISESLKDFLFIYAISLTLTYLFTHINATRNESEGDV
jgi:hypothetical protein